MATLRQYTTRMRNVHAQVAEKMGSDTSGLPKSIRVAVAAVFVVLAIVVKTIVDKGLVTDAELLSSLDDLPLQQYDDEPT